MWKALPAALVGLLIGGTAYLLAGPGDGNSTSPATVAVSSAGVTTVELANPCKVARHAQDPGCGASRRSNQRRNHDRVQMDNGQIVHVGDGTSPSSRPHKAPGRRNTRRALRNSPAPAGPGSDDGDGSGDSDSQDSGSGDSESGNSDGD